MHPFFSPFAVFRGVQLLERDKRFSEALHYLGILLACGSRALPDLGLRTAANKADNASAAANSEMPLFPGGAVMLGEVCGREWLRGHANGSHAVLYLAC